MGEKQIESFSTNISKLAHKALAALPGMIGSIFSRILKQHKRSGWLVISESVGTYNRCWILDPHIFYDKNENKIHHLNIHHTVKIAVTPNIKAAISSS